MEKWTGMRRHCSLFLCCMWWPGPAQDSILTGFSLSTHIPDLYCQSICESFLQEVCLNCSR